MSWETERTAIVQYFTTNWVVADGPVMYENQPFTQPAGIFLALTILVSGSRQASLKTTATLYRTLGNVQVDVYAPENKGTADARKLADKITRLFLNKNLTTTDGDLMSFGVPSITILGNRNGRYRIAVTCPYRRDERIAS